MGRPKVTLPPNAYVSLSEALTWIAFGDSMPADTLRAQVEGDRPIPTLSSEERLRAFFQGEDNEAQVPGIGYFHDRQAGIAQLTEAWRWLREQVERGLIRARGRYSSTYSPSDASLADVEELTGAKLATFSQFDVSTGGIRRQPLGSPDILWQDDPLSFDREFAPFSDDGRAADGYLIVQVERAGVLSSVAGGATLTLLCPDASCAPASPFLATEIGQWITAHPQYTSMKKARNAFMKEERAKGLSASFENVWREMWPRSRGRPPKRELAK